jgi:hypothetical protein
MMQENNMFQQNIIHITLQVKHMSSSTTRKRILFWHIHCNYLPHVFSKIIYNLFDVVVKVVWER